MTAEVAILNRQAIVLAADSAVTVGRERVWKTVNKLFSLGPHHDIAIMIYGSGEFLTYPWEVLVKEFRKSVVGKKFNKTEECAEKFIEFLAKVPAEAQTQANSILFPVIRYILFIEDKVRDDEGVFDLDEALKLVKRFREQIQKKPTATSPDDAELRALISEMLREMIEGDFGTEDTGDLVNEFIELAVDLFKVRQESDYSTGLVVAGYGAGEYFPCLLHYTIDGRFQGIVRHWPEEGANHNMNEPGATSCIIPFAQKDMSVLFMEGITHGCLSFLNRAAKEFLEESLKETVLKLTDDGPDREAALADASNLAKRASKKLLEDFKEHRQDRFVSPVLSAVNALPKEEMAAMAEALVDLTSLRRKVDSKLDTVGGPVDVAVISKGDGFVWVKRKHYFKIELNPDFLDRRSRELGVAQ